QSRTRLRELRAHEAARGQRGVAVAALERARLVAHPGACCAGARARLCRPVAVPVREPREEVKDKQANRRIRLLLAVFLLVFTVPLGRAVGLKGVRAAQLGKMAERQHHESIVVPAGRGTIFDSTGVQLALGEATTTVYADPRQVTQPRALSVAAHRYLGIDANALYPRLVDRRTSFLYVKRFADPADAQAFLKKG